MQPISAIIYEPSTHMLEFLKNSGFSMDGDSGCLPRCNISELRYALNFINPAAFIVRATELQRCDELSTVVFNLYAQGVEVIVVQDSGVRFQLSTTSFGNLHFVSNLGEVDELRRLVVLAQLKSISRQSQRSTLL